jgi:hypothetical protein
MRRFDRVWREARRVLDEEQVKTPKVPIERIARKYAVVIETEIEDGVSGMLVPLDKPNAGRSWAIVVNKNHPKTRRRFTIAHELGHIVLHEFRAPHADRSYKLRFRDGRSSDGSISEEIEANQFAAEVLMPRAMFLERIVKYGLEYAGLDEDDSTAHAISEIAAEFHVSKAAVSVRIANLLM